ncbi:hypothetical protein LXA43DRAFT_431013 [Ganoderma leucocontextum]|nr:hypothetical protein LXA43DRAFT_431013 [Ganoderma leucocontextum]
MYITSSAFGGLRERPGESTFHRFGHKGDSTDDNGGPVYAGNGSVVGDMTTMSPVLELRSTWYAEIPVVPNVKDSSPLPTKHVLGLSHGMAWSVGLAVVGQSESWMVSQTSDSTTGRWGKCTRDILGAPRSRKRDMAKGLAAHATARLSCMHASAVKPNMRKKNIAHGLGVHTLKLITDTPVASWRQMTAATLSTRPKREWRSAKPRYGYRP